MEFRCGYFSMMYVVLNHYKSVLENLHSVQMSTKYTYILYIFSIYLLNICIYTYI